LKHIYLPIGCVVLGAVLGSLGLSLLQGQGPKPADRPRDVTTYRDVVKKVMPAVVSVNARVRKAVGPRRGGDTAFALELPGVWPVPAVEGLPDDPHRVGFGSGFLISPKGVVVTNNHVVRGADYVVIKFKDGKKATSKKVFTDPKTDLAIVQLDGPGPYPYLEWGNSDEMEIGDRVLAVGAPFGLTGTVTHGIISSVGRALCMNMYEDFLQTDAAINPGNSGGPLVNIDGKVIGINSAIKSRSGGFQGIGLAISSKLGKDIVRQLLRDGTVKRGYLGVSIDDLTEETARALGVDTPGVVVAKVYRNSPGESAGLRKGDVLRSLGGKPLRDVRELQTVVAHMPLDKAVELIIIRDKKELKVKVTIKEQPATFGTARAGVPDVDRDGTSVDSVGIVLYDLTPELGALLKFPEEARGAVVIRMKRSGIGGKAGLLPGMLITRVDGKTVRSARDAVDSLKAGSLSKGITVEARSSGGPPRRITLKAG
jgi:serine protease Do